MGASVGRGIMKDVSDAGCHVAVDVEAFPTSVGFGKSGDKAIGGVYEGGV